MSVVVSEKPKQPTHDISLGPEHGKMGEVPKDPRIHEKFEAQIITSGEQAREMQAAGVKAKLDKRITGIEKAFKRGEKISFQDAYQDAAMALVNIIHDVGSKDVDRIRAFKALNEELARQLGNAVKMPSTFTQHNYNMTPDDARSILSMRCPDCRALMKPGVQHDCEVIDA